MPQITHDDRCLINAENTLWNALELLNQIESAGAFHDRIEEIGLQLDKLATEMREYNEQFEEE